MGGMVPEIVKIKAPAPVYYKTSVKPIRQIENLALTGLGIEKANILVSDLV